jgi:hypothetical protein
MSLPRCGAVNFGTSRQVILFLKLGRLFILFHDIEGLVGRERLVLEGFKLGSHRRHDRERVCPIGWRHEGKCVGIGSTQAPFSIVIVVETDLMRDSPSK